MYENLELDLDLNLLSITLYGHIMKVVYCSVLTNVKDKERPELRPGAVYKICCNDCDGAFISKMDKNMAQQKEHFKKKLHRKTQQTTLLNMLKK